VASKPSLSPTGLAASCHPVSDSQFLFPQAANQSENQVADEDYKESEYEEFCDIPMG